MPPDSDQLFNFDAPVLACFQLLGPGLPNVQRNEAINQIAVSFRESKIDDLTALNINPFVWLSFRDSQLIANATMPNAVSMPIDDVQFLVLNHCVVSKRGDRSSRSVDLMKLFGISKASLDKLLQGELLLCADEVTTLRAKIDLWCRRGWYQSLLAYLDMWSSLRHVDPPSQLGNSDNGVMQTSQVNQLLWTQWELLRTQRVTTRAFYRDVPTMNMLEPEANTDRIFYLLAFGVPLKKKARTRNSSNDQQFEISERLAKFKSLLTDGCTELFDENGETVLMCDSNGALSGVHTSDKNGFSGKPA